MQKESALSAAAADPRAELIDYVRRPRPAIEAEIERLIAFLDALDDDPDLEPDDGDYEENWDREEDHAEAGIGDRDGLELAMSDGAGGVSFDGTGVRYARTMLRRGVGKKMGRDTDREKIIKISDS